MGEWAILALVAVGFGGAVGLVYRMTRGAGAEGAWRAVAAKHRTTLLADEATRRIWFEADVGLARVHAETVLGVGALQGTTVRAAYVMAAGPEFQVESSGPLSTRDRNDVDIGDEEFDERFVVHARDGEATRVAWSGYARKMRMMLPSVTVGSDGLTVELGCVPGLSTIADVEVAVSLVAELAAYRSGLLKSLEALPDAVFHRPSGAAVRRSPFVRLPSGACIGPVAHGFSGVIAAWAAAAENAPRRRFVVARGGTVEGEVAGGLPEAAARELQRVGECSVRVEDGEVEVRWTVLHGEGDLLLAGARLCLALATPAVGGAFR